MTAKKDLKKLVRERQAQTGERYTTALEHVLGKRQGSAVPVIELLDLTAAGERLGFKCRVAMAPALAERIDGAVLLERLRDALLATESDPATELMRRVVLRGEKPPQAVWSLDQLEEGRRFIARARAGIGGTSDSGRMLALHIGGERGLETAICLVWPIPVPALVDRPPALILTTAEGIGEPAYSLWGLRP